ncbi:MAG: carboxypeptidase regulatory-like domain-containing protein [Bacteroidetes bacterium]|nr:carboxypeptidase regulatory-like domain-containing protein [Bacteroidota bacterium]
MKTASSGLMKTYRIAVTNIMIEILICFPDYFIVSLMPSTYRSNFYTYPMKIFNKILINLLISLISLTMISFVWFTETPIKPAIATNHITGIRQEIAFPGQINLQPSEMIPDTVGWVSGKVTAYGYNFPIIGATVTLTNECYTYTGVTGAYGHYSIGAPAGFYTLIFSADGYATVSDIIEIQGGQYLVCDAQLLEFPYPVLNVHAQINNLDDLCHISWYNFNDFYTIAYDDGIADEVTAWPQGGNMNAVKFTPAGYPANVFGAEINIYDGTWPQGNTLTPFHVAIYDDDGTDNMPGSELAITEAEPYGYGWVFVDFSNSNVIVNDGYFYIVMIQGGDFPDCAPIAVDTTNPIYRSYSKNVSGGEEWTEAGYNDFMIRSYIYSDSDKTNTGEIQKSGLESKGNRALSHYEVFRLLKGDEANPENWTIVDDLVLENFLVDTGWTAIDTGLYRYAVIASYSYNASEPAFSNLVRNGFTMTINIVISNGESAHGALVNLVNQDNDPQHKYEAISPWSGMVTISDIVPGIYDLTVVKYYYIYEESSIQVYDNVFRDVYIINEPMSFPDIYYINCQELKICWYTFADQYCIYAEDFESCVIPYGWRQEYVDSTIAWTVGKGSPSGVPDHASSREFNASFIDNSAITTLVVPELDVSGLVRPHLQFQHAQAGDSVQDKLKVYYKKYEDDAWHPLETYSQNQPEWEKEVIYLHEPSEFYSIGFTGLVNPGGMGVCIDDIKILATDTSISSPHSPRTWFFGINGSDWVEVQSEGCISLDTMTQIIPGQVYVFGFWNGEPLHEIFYYTFVYIPCDYYNPPGNFEGSVNGMNITLTWSPPEEIQSDGTVSDTNKYIESEGGKRDDCTGYFIYRNGERLNNDVYPDTIFTQTISPGGVYQYNVTAAYGSTTESCLLDTPYTIVAGENLFPPDTIIAQPLDEKRALLNWSSEPQQQGIGSNSSPRSELTGYNLWRNNKKIYYLPATETSYIDTIIVPKTYDYYVSAVYDTMESFRTGPATITFYGKGHLSGCITDAISRSPIENAVISLFPGNINDTSDANGSYHIYDLPVGIYEITVTAVNYDQVSETGISIKYGLMTEKNFELFNEEVSFVPFTETWQAGTFEYQHWTFGLEQAYWDISSDSGSPPPSATFTCESNASNYANALISPIVYTGIGMDSVIVSYDLKISDAFYLDPEILTVDIWNGLYWSQLIEYTSYNPADWTHFRFEVSDMIQGPLMKVRFVAKGIGQCSSVTWHIDNIEILTKRMATLSGRVTDTAGSFIDDAIVTVEGYDPVHADIYGLYSADVEEGVYDVTAAADGYLTKTIDSVNIFGMTFLDIELQMITSLPDMQDSKGLTLYPNPAIDELHIYSDVNIKRIKILNSFGQNVCEEIPVSGSMVSINTIGFSQGIYFVQCFTGNGDIINKKFLILK